MRATPAQEALWRAQRDGASAGTLNLHWRLSLTGDVDAGKLRLAWAALVRRHEALRTGLSAGSGHLLQEVQQSADGSLGLVTWDDDDDELRERLGQELHARAFDLARPPLARAVLLRAGDTRELHVCGHRAVLDDGCLPVLLRDLAAAYGRLARGQAPAFDGEPVPFGALAAERGRALDDRSRGTPEAHRRSDLAGARTVHLAAGAPGTWRGELDVAVLRAPLSEAAAEAARSPEVGPLAACLAAVWGVLGRSQPGAWLAVGVEDSNRRSERDRSILGPLATTVPVAFRVYPKDPLRSLLGRARATVDEVHRHGHVPATAVLDTTPSMVAAERREPEVAPALAGAPPRLLPRAGSGIGPGVDVQVAMITTRTGLALELEYRTAALDRGAVATLAADLDRVLALAARAPDLAVGAVPVRSRTTTVPAAAIERSAHVAPGPPTRGSLVTLRSGGRPHVHLFHPGGGNSTHYQPLVAALPEDWTVTASDDCGQGDTIEDLAERYLRELLSATGPPDVLGGWSMGGVVAYHAIRLLRGTAARLPALLLVDSAPPIGYGPEGERVVEQFAESVWMSLSLRRFRPAELTAGDDDAMCALAAGLWRAGDTVRPDWLLQRLDEYRRHLRATMRYVCADCLTVPAVVIAAVLDEPLLEDWRRRLPPGTPTVRLAGGHFDVLRHPLVEEVARQLTSLHDRMD